MMGFAIPAQKSCAAVPAITVLKCTLLNFAAGDGEKSVLLLCYLQSCSAVLHHSQMTFILNSSFWNHKCKTLPSFA